MIILFSYKLHVNNLRWQTNKKKIIHHKRDNLKTLMPLNRFSRPRHHSDQAKPRQWKRLILLLTRLLFSTYMTSLPSHRRPDFSFQMVDVDQVENSSLVTCIKHSRLPHFGGGGGGEKAVSRDC